MVAECVSDVLSGYGVRIVDAAEVGELPNGILETNQYAMAHLYQLGTAILYFHPKQRLQREMPAGVGVLEHITSLPMDDGEPEEAAEPKVEAAATAESAEQVDEIDAEDEEDVVVAMPKNPGTLGAAAFAFVDWLAEAGVHYWQVLPVNPTDEHGSPYAGISAFAGNVRLLEGGLDDFDDFADMPEYQEFCAREADWLEPYAAFMAIREHVGEGISWQEWPERYRTFKPDVLEVRYNGKNIDDILNMSVDETIEFFSAGKETLAQGIARKLKPLVDVGLGYIKLAYFLSMSENSSSMASKKILFLFDEPTTGLHFYDVEKLLKAFDVLLSKGHSLIVVEHNLDVIRAADWVIDLGPDAGDKGGEVVFEGTPEDLAAHGDTFTARYLRESSS